MNLVEYMTENDFWGALGLISPSYLLGYSATQLDTLTTLTFGDRVMNPKVEGLDVTDVALVVSMFYGKKWDTLLSNSLSELKITSGTVTKLNNVNHVNETDNRTGENLHKISAYNSDELINDGGDTSTNTNVKNLTNERDQTREHLSLNNVLKNLTTLEKISIIRVIVTDVINFITLSIY